MKTKDINFLNDLKKEILSQDNRQTRDVMFVVRETETDYGYADDYSDDEYLCVDGEVFKTLDEFLEKAEDYPYYNGDEESTDYSMCYDLESVQIKLHEEGHDAYMCGIKNKDVFNLNCGSSVFFTEKACKEFIVRNKHNLSKPVCYGISSYGNPEMNQLREIITTTDWNSILKEKEKNNKEQIEKENQKLRKTIEILKEKFELELLNGNELHFNFSNYDSREINDSGDEEIFHKLSNNETKLLEEVLGCEN